MRRQRVEDNKLVGRFTTSDYVVVDLVKETHELAFIDSTFSHLRITVYPEENTNVDATLRIYNCTKEDLLKLSEEFKKAAESFESN